MPLTLTYLACHHLDCHFINIWMAYHVTEIWVAYHITNISTTYHAVTWNTCHITNFWIAYIVTNTQGTYDAADICVTYHVVDKVVGHASFLVHLCFQQLNLIFFPV